MIAVVRRRLTYANVMSTLAVFIALGGASYAATQLPAGSVGTKQLKAHAVTKGKLSKSLVKSLRLHCRSGTRAIFGVCFEKTLRSPANFYTAAYTCEQRGGRLPTVGEIEAARQVPGLLASHPVIPEIIGDGTYDSMNGPEYLTAPTLPPGFSQEPTTGALPYRCIYQPSN